MEKIEISNKLEDNESVIRNIYRVSNQIKTRLNRDLDKEKCTLLYENIIEVLNYWTRNTYIGQKKDKGLSKAFQQFFENLLDLMLSKKNKGYSLSECGLYQGKIYRVLGNGYDHIFIKKHIEPEFNQTFVSWSKNEQIPTPYFKQKLYGPITKMEAELDGLNYGIDLEFWGVTINDEKEIVFPTIENTITKIDYL